jgi:tetratricopeptide (TPR) repeat protein
MDNPLSRPSRSRDPAKVAEVADTSATSGQGEEYADPPLPPAEPPPVRALGRLLDSWPPSGAEPPTPPGYEILEELGRGGMGVVYKARQLGLNRIVALKMVLAGPHSGPEQIARFRAEAEAAARLRHPHIVPVYEVGDWNSLPFFSMEFVDGGSLELKLRATPLPVKVAAELVGQLARAVQAAHQAGVVHRDLKPANVLLTADGTPKITDFGLAKQLDSEPAADRRTRTGAILGTPSYMAPEQAAGRPQAVGPPADVYALGAILYELLTGRPPFKTADVLQTLEQVRSQEPVSPSRMQPNLPRDLATICLKCLEKDPARRYATAAELADDLQRFRAGEPIRARPVSRAEHLLKWCRRKPTQAALVGVTVLAAVALAAGAAWHNHQLQEEVRRANAGEAEARTQKSRALAQFRKGHETLDLLLTRMEEDEWRSTDPRAVRLQREVEQAALRYYYDVLHDVEDPDPEVRLNKALVFVYAANAHRLLGQFAEARADYRRARAMIEELVAEHPDSADYRYELAFCVYREADLALRQRELAQAEKGHLEALEIDEAILRDRPGFVKAVRNQAYCHWQLTQVYEHMEKPQRAADQAAASVASWAQLLDGEPANDMYRTRLGQGLLNLVRLRNVLKRWDDAETAARKAEEVLRPMADPLPQDLSNLMGPVHLAELYRHWGFLLMIGRNQPRSALEKFTAGIELLDRVLRQEPELREARAIQQGLLYSRSVTHEALGEMAEMLRDRERSCTLAEGDARDVCRVDFAICLTRAGQHARAVAEARAVSAKPAVPAATRWLLATAFGHAAVAAERDDTLTSPERERLRDKYGSLSLAELRRCQQAGYFKDANRRQQLLTDPALGVIRAREDFKKLLPDVEKSK